MRGSLVILLILIFSTNSYCSQYSLSPEKADTAWESFAQKVFWAFVEKRVDDYLDLMLPNEEHKKLIQKEYQKQYGKSASIDEISKANNYYFFERSELKKKLYEYYNNNKEGFNDIDWSKVKVVDYTYEVKMQENGYKGTEVSSFVVFEYNGKYKMFRMKRTILYQNKWYYFFLPYFKNYYLDMLVDPGKW